MTWPAHGSAVGTWDSNVVGNSQIIDHIFGIGSCTSALTYDASIKILGCNPAINAATLAGSTWATPPSIGNTTPNTGAFSGLTLSSVTGLTQCLHVDATGIVSGTSADCSNGSQGLNNVLLYASGIAINDGSAHLVSAAPAGSVFNGKTTLAGIAAITINGATPFSWITAAPFTGSGAYALVNADVANLDIAWLAIQAAMMTGKTYIPAGTYIVGSVKALPLYIPLAVETNTTVSAVKIMIQGDGARVSIIKAGTDFGSGVPLIACGNPAGTFANSLGRYVGAGGQCSGDMQDVGFFSSTGNLTPAVGTTPINMDGIAWGARLRTKDVEASGFNHDWTLVGDHTKFIRPRAFGGTIGFEWATPSSVLAGDLAFDDFMVSGQSIASISIASGATIGGAMFNGETYLSAPIAIRAEGGSCTVAMSSVTFDELFDEFIGNAMFSDESGLAAGVWTDSNKCRNLTKVHINQWFQNWDASKLWTTGGRGRRAVVDAAQVNIIVDSISGAGAQMAPITPASGPTPIATFNVNKFVVDTQAGTSISGDIYGWNTQNAGTGLGIPLWVAADSSQPYLNATGQSQGQELVLGIQGAAGGPTKLSMYGNTSGKATITGPNVAGTTTNAFVSSNNISAPALASTVAIGTAPLTVTSTTVVPNLNVSQLLGNTWAAPGTIGGTTPGAGHFAALDATSGITAISDGVHAGILSALGNTTAPSIPSNSFGFIGPNSASFTSYFLQPPATAPVANNLLRVGAPSSNVSALTYGTNCSAVGSAASPSLVACGGGTEGSFSCATNATGATCVVSTTAVTANSQIFVQEDETLGARLSVTCNTGTNVLPTSRLLAARSAGVSFTINLGTVTTNPACFSYFIVN